jgi:hypothetical protein
MVLEAKEVNTTTLNPGQLEEMSDSQKKEIWGKAHSTKMSPWGDISAATGEESSEEHQINLNTISGQLEHIINWSVDTYGQDTFAKAKEEFYLLAGKFFYDDPYYHQRIHYFLDYFIFERKISDHLQKVNGEAPYFEYINSDTFALSANDDSVQKSILDLRNFKHSIYLVKKVSLSELTVVDLLSKEKFKLSPTDNQTFQGLQKGQVFQSYVYDWNGKYHLSKGVVLHPRQSWGVILKACKIFRKNQKIQPHSLIMSAAKLQIDSKIRKPQAIKIFYQNTLL